MEKLIKEAFIAGYEQGHNDTVESGYGCSPDKADEYYLDISNQVQAGVKPEIAELKKILNEVFEMLLEAPELNMGNYDENQVRELNYAVISTFNYLKNKREQFSV